MNVIFLKPIPPYVVGQVADVAEGYAKNFLIPKKFAAPATAHAIREARQRADQRVAIAESAAQDVNRLAQVLQGATVHLHAKAAGSGTLYAAVTPKHIAAAIATHTGLAVPETLQKQFPAVKHTGQHAIPLRIGSITITFTLDV